MCRACYNKEALHNFHARNADETYRAARAAQGRSIRRNTPAIHLYNLAKRRSKVSQWEFTITVEDIHIPEVCPVLGIPLFVGDGKHGPNSPTLDRFDNSRGYTADNIRVISYRANSLKSDATVDELRRVLAYMEG